MDASSSGIMSDLRKAAATARPWAFLSPDLLADVCSRLHDAVDFVRFHAVCTPWRHAVPAMISPATPPHAFLPWLVTQCNGRIMHSPVIYFGRIASEPRPNNRSRGYSVVLAGRGASSTGGDGNWVGSADGRSAYLFTGGHEPTLFNLLTGAVTRLPPFRIEDDDEIEWLMTNPRGTVYGDGTVFLYSFDSWRVFKAAILRPSDTAWTLVETRLDLPAEPYHSCAAYRGGKVLLWVGAYWWCLVTPDFGANGSTTYGFFKTTWDRLEDEYYTRDHSHVFESRGELLWASVLVERQKPDDLAARYNYSTAPTLAVRVHALEEEEADGGGRRMRWAERDDRSLGDRVLFLGSPTSFAANATELGVDGGCAYFVFNRQVFRYSFVDDQAKPVEWMCPGWRGANMARMWLRPRQPRLFATPSNEEEE